MLDPKGILAPGKNGIWPANYDKKAWRILVCSETLSRGLELVFGGKEKVWKVSVFDAGVALSVKD